MYRQHYFIIFICSLITPGIYGHKAHTKDSSQLEDDNSKAAVIVPGDLLLGGLFPIHQKTRNGDCSEKINVDGILALETFLYTLDLVNPVLQKETGITLGAIALDTCSTGRVALFNALKFVLKDYLERKQGRREDVNTVVDPVDAAAKTNESEVGYSNVIGVVGPMSNSVTVQVANLLSLFRMPQISYAATSSSLNNRRSFPYFLRTVPSDKHQARVLVELLRAWNWTYIIGAYEDNNNGAPSFHELEKAAENSGICFASRWKLNADQTVTTINETRLTLRKLAEEAPEAKAFVLYVRPSVFELIMKAALEEGLVDRFIWIGTEVWGNRVIPLELTPAVEGALVSVPVLKRFPGFFNYFYSLNASNNDRNIWFKEFWRDVFECESAEDDAMCLNKGTLDAVVKNSRFTSLHTVRDAVVAFATTLQKMHEVGCHGGRRGLCYRMRTWIGDPDRVVLLEYLRNATFPGVDGSEVRFVEGYDGIPDYTLMNYQKSSSNRSNATDFSWVTVGSAGIAQKPGQPFRLRVQKSRIRFNGVNVTDPFPQSICGRPCPLGHIRRYSKNKCCWSCEPCPFPTYPVNQSHCDMCPILNPNGPSPQFFRVSGSLDHCEPMKPEFVHCFNNAVVGVVAVACAIGLVITALTVSTFMYYSSTPIIKASGRELSIVLLCGIAVSYATVFIIASPPSAFTCGLSKFLYSTGYTLCYGSLFVKTNLIARIFRPSTSSYLPFRRSSDSAGNSNFQTVNIMKRVKYISPLAQVLFVFGLVSFQTLINAVWFILRPPSPAYKIHFDYYRQEVTLYKLCRAFLHEDMVIALLFPVTLLLFASFYAFRTRKCPGKFNEMKYIMMTTYSACIVWLAFIPVFFATEQLHLRIYALCASLCINATVALFCMSGPKLFVVLYRPEKNTKDAVMGKKDKTSVPSSPCDNFVAFPQVSSTSTRSSVASALVKDVESSSQQQPLLSKPLFSLGPQSKNVPGDLIRISCDYDGQQESACRDLHVPKIVLTTGNDDCCQCRKRRRSF